MAEFKYYNDVLEEWVRVGAQQNCLPVHALDEYDVDTCYDAGLYLIDKGKNVPSGAPYGVLLVLSYRKPFGNTIPDYCS